MNKVEITSRIKSIAKYNHILSDIDVNAKFVDLGLDSLDVMELVMAIEKDFRISIPDSKIEKFENIQNIVDYIHDLK